MNRQGVKTERYGNILPSPPPALKQTRVSCLRYDQSYHGGTQPHYPCSLQAGHSIMNPVTTLKVSAPTVAPGLIAPSKAIVTFFFMCAHVIMTYSILQASEAKENVWVK